MGLAKSQSPEKNKPVGYDLADFSYETDGSINVAFTDYDMASPINIYKVSCFFFLLSLDSITNSEHLNFNN